MIQNTKADQGSWRGDALDIGYWGSDGTASVYWGMTVPGIDVSGVSPIDVMRAEFQYAMYNVSLSTAFGANRINIFGGIATPQAILKATDAHTGLYGDGSRPGSGSVGSIGVPIGQLVGGVADLVGKILNIPNDIIGLGVVLATGAQFDGFSNNAAQFTGANLPSFIEAITIGNVQIYRTGYTDQSYVPSPYTPGFWMWLGYHEQGHTYQSQTLGPLFIPFYFLSKLFGNPFETGADHWARSHQPPPPGGR